MIFVFDIDGTLANIGRRYEKAGDAPPKKNRKLFQAWLNRLQKKSDLMEDPAIPGMLNLVQSLSVCRHTIVYLTGRDEKYREVTERWLFRSGFPTGEVLMRVHEDLRDTKEYKEEQMIEVVKKYGNEQILVFDDDPEESCGEVYKRHGWTWLRPMENVE